MVVKVKVIEVRLGYQLELTTGYRASSRLCHGQTDFPITWPNRDAAVIWAKSTGYTIEDEHNAK